MATPAGPRNLITDVPGIPVGQAEDPAGITGVTAVLTEAPTASVDARGGAPGSRETELLAPGILVDRIDAVVLSGGFAFGLDAAAGVMDWLAEANRGFTVGSLTVPIVPAAILFDLAFPGRHAWAGEPPYRALGREAVAAAAKEFLLGNAGAGLGARAGRLKGGIGSASSVLADGTTVGAIVAVNSWGAVMRPDCGRLWAADLALAGEIDRQLRSPMPGSIWKTSRNAAPPSWVPTRRSRLSPPSRWPASRAGGSCGEVRCDHRRFHRRGSLTLCLVSA